MSFFDSWDTVQVCRVRPSAWRNRVVLKQYTKQTPTGPKEYRRLIVSKNLIEESGSENFILKNKGDLYAIIPDEMGQLHAIGSRMLGISSSVLDEIAEKIGDEECQASVIDGAIVFPIRDNFIIG